MCKHQQFYQFLKMALITRERLMKNDKNGMDFYNKALKFCEENFCDMVAKDGEES